MKSILRHAFITAPLWSSLAYGLGIRIPDQDTAATSRGNAFAATADNPSAVYYNPAGISQIVGQEVSVGSYIINLHSYYTSPAGNDSETKSKVAVVPEVFYAGSFKDFPISVGIGFYSPYGLGLEWPDNDTFRALRGEIQYFTLNPVVSWKILDTLSVAIGPTLNYGKTDFRQTFYPNIPFIPGVPGGQIRFKGDDTDVGFNGGILWHPVPKHSFGFSYFSATTMNFKGDASLTGLSGAPGPFAVPDIREDASAQFKFPQHMVAGWSYRPTEKWNFEVNVDWTDWNTLNTVTLKSGPALGNTALPFNWNSSFFYEFGVTRHFENNWDLSAGYIYSENSVPDATFTALVPDSNRHIFSIGIGRRYEHFSWNAGYQLAWGPEREVSTSSNLVFPQPLPALGIGSSANGRYSFLSHALSLNVRYLF